MWAWPVSASRPTGGYSRRISSSIPDTFARATRTASRAASGSGSSSRSAGGRLHNPSPTSSTSTASPANAGGRLQNAWPSGLEYRSR
jgi:hypothetical protein